MKTSSYLGQSLALGAMLVITSIIAIVLMSMASGQL